MTKIPSQILGKRSFWRPPLRPVGVVVNDFFKKGVALSWRTRRYLAWYPEKQYNAILALVEGLNSPKKRFNKLYVDPPELVRGIDFSALSASFLLEQINGLVLDLRKLNFKLNQFRKRTAVHEDKVFLPVRLTAQSKGEESIRAQENQERGGLVDRGRPYSSERFLPPGLSRAISYRRYGHTVKAEIIDEQKKKGSNILGSFYEFINEVCTDCWGVMDPQFAKERLIVAKGVYQWVDGERASYTSAQQKIVPKLGNRVVTWIEIGITKQKFQEMGLQTRAVYWLIRDAYLEELSKFIASKGRFTWLSFLLAVPSLVWAGLYVLGWVNKPPADIAKIKATVAYLAVHPISFEPILKYAEDVYPNPYKPELQPTPEQLEIARAVLPEGVKFDENNFVVEGDYGGIEHLIPDPTIKPGEKGGVLHSRDPVVNEFMWKRLRYEDRAGRDLFVLMNVSLEDFRRYFEVQRRRKRESATKQKVLDMAKGM